MFKKTLLALAVAGVSITTANAATIVTSVTEIANGSAVACNGDGVANDTASNVNGVFETQDTRDTTPAVGGTCFIPETSAVTPTASSVEAAQNTTVALSPKIIAGIGGYADGTTITVAITGGSIDLVNSVTPTLTSVAGGSASVLDITASAVRFKIDVGAGDVVFGGKEIATLSGVFLDASALSSGADVKMDSKGTNTAGVDFDVAAAASVATLVPQYSTTVTTSLDGVVDVSNERQSLAVNANDDFAGEIINEDTVVVEVSLDATGTVLVPANVTYTFSGDFTWLEDSANLSDDGVAATPAEIATHFALVGNTFFTPGNDDVFTSATLNDTFDELTVVTTAGADNLVDATSQFQFNVLGLGTGNPVLSENTYSVSVSVEDDAATGSAVDLNAGSAAAGAWTLNGSVVEVPYMPFGPNTQPILRHTNTGLQTGDISARYMLEGVDSTWQSVGVVVEDAAPGLVNLLGPVMDAVVAATGATSGKVALEITTNVPGADVTVFAAAKVSASDQDRLTIGAFSN